MSIKWGDVQTMETASSTNVVLIVLMLVVSATSQDRVPDEVKKPLGHPRTMVILFETECATTTSRSSNQRCANVDLRKMGYTARVALANIRNKPSEVFYAAHA